MEQHGRFILNSGNARRQKVMIYQDFQAGQSGISTVRHLLRTAKNDREQLQIISQAIVASFDAACCRIWTLERADQCDACGHALSGLCQYRESCLHLRSWAGPPEVFSHLLTRVALGCPEIVPLVAGGEESCLRNDWGGVPAEGNTLGICSFAGYRLSDHQGQLRGVMAVFADQAISQAEYEAFAGLAAFASRIIQVADLEQQLAQEGAERKRLERNLRYVYQVLAQKEADHRQYAEQLSPQTARAHIREATARMAGGLAHELNNILAGLIGYPDLLLAQLPVGSSLQRGLEFVRECGLQVAAMVDELLAVSHGAAAASCEISQLNELIRQHLASPEHQQLAAAHPEINFASHFDPQLHAITWPAGQLITLVKDLLRNAVDVLPGSLLAISTTNRHLDDPMAGYEEILPGDYVVLSVTGQGQATAPQELDRLFEPFYAKRVMGRPCSGLGLAKVWNLVHQHGGAIEVISTSRETRFDLYFRTAGEKGLDRSHDPAQFAGQGETILVVDDEPSQRETVGQLLTNLNYRVNTAASGEEAVALFETQPFDLVILDMVMPGLSGLATYERMQRLRPMQRAIMTSGYAESDEINRALQLGVAAFIRKPYTLQQLGEAIQQALQRKSGAMANWEPPVH